MAKERIPERTPERKPMSDPGPQAVPEEYKDENFVYRWGNYDPERPFKFQKKFRMGYDFVPVSEFEQMRDKMIFNEMFGGSAVDGTRICRKAGRGTIDYLLRCPKERYLENRKILNDAAKEPLKGIKRDAEQLGGAYSENENLVPRGFD